MHYYFILEIGGDRYVIYMRDHHITRIYVNDYLTNYDDLHHSIRETILISALEALHKQRLNATFNN